MPRLVEALGHVLKRHNAAHYLRDEAKNALASCTASSTLFASSRRCVK